MEQEFPVPDFGKYTVTADGKVYSYYAKGGSRRQLKLHKVKKRSCSHRLFCYVSLQVPGEDKKKQVSLPRLMLAAKLGRWLEPWEQARHLDGNANNNHMDNLEPGCVINNMLDDIENGTRQTNAANIDLAIQRLKNIRLFVT